MSQIEILGVSLPWRDVFSNEGPGARINELTKKFQKEANPFSHSSDANPFSVTSLSSEIVSPSVKQSSSTNWLDLLTGEDMFSEPVSQSATQNNVHEGSDFLNFLDEAVIDNRGTETDHKFSSSKDVRPPDSSAQKYINCLKSLAGPQMVWY